MADDRVAIWNSGLKFGRKPANGELLIGNGDGFTLSNIQAGSGVSIIDTAGGIEISATGSGGTVTDVTATSPLASSGGSTPNISLSGAVGVANGGTGASTLTANNVILGNGTSAVQFVAPGTIGNLLQSDGTTWGSAAVPLGRQLLTTLTTTSGTTAGLTGISTTAYTALICVLMLNSHNGSGGANQSLQLEMSENNGSTWLTASTLTAAIASGVLIAAATEIYNFKTSTSKLGMYFANATVTSIYVTSTAPINAIRFKWSLGASFNAGTIQIYGVP